MATHIKEFISINCFNTYIFHKTYLSLISHHWICGIYGAFIKNDSVVRKLNLDDILIIWLSWPDPLGVVGVRISSTVSEPALSQTPTSPPLSTNMMNIRDDGVYWYLWMCYAIHPSCRRIPFDNGYKVLRHDVYPIPVITSHRRVSG